MKNVAIYPGTFDPITLGHLDVIKTAANFFEKVYVALMVNPAKSPRFSLELRKQMVLGGIKEYGITNAEIVSSSKLTVRFAKELGARVIVKGLRLTPDFENELNQFFNNKVLDEDISTFFIPSSHKLIHVSSSMVRNLLDYRDEHTDKALRNYVPDSVLQFLTAKPMD